MPESLTASTCDLTVIQPRPSCVVLVMSCDAYKDLWTPFFTLFWRYWNDCPWPVYLGTNQELFPDERVTTVKTGDHAWSERVRFCLNEIDSDFVLLMLEDYFLDSPVSTSELNRALDALASLGGAQLRLYPLPGPNRKAAANPAFGSIDSRAAYRVSTQAAFWKREHLIDLLAVGESIWDFEWKGTERSRNYAGYYATYRAILRYEQVIERGEWFRGAARRFGSQNIGCDFTVRPVMTRATALKRGITTAIRYWNLRVMARLKFGG